MRTLVLAALATLAFSGAASAQSIRIASEGAYAPWNFIDESGNLAGFEIELGTELCARAELECTFVANEWDTIIPNLLAGNYDAIMAGMSITDERMETIDFTQNYFPPDPSLFVTTSGTTLDFGNLSGKRIGVQGATIQAAYAEDNFAGANTIVSFETADQAMADLAAGNLDLILADGAYLEPVVTASAGAIVFAGPEVLIGNGVGMGLRKEDDELQTKFDSALDAVKADGTLDQLIAKWFEGRGPYFATQG
jgi:polar amino acid transport system substrate-binding protein